MEQSGRRLAAGMLMAWAAQVLPSPVLVCHPSPWYSHLAHSRRLINVCCPGRESLCCPVSNMPPLSGPRCERSPVFKAAQIHPLHVWYWHGFLRSTEEVVNTLDSLCFLIHLPLLRVQELRVVNRSSLPIWVSSPLHALILPCPL